MSSVILFGASYSVYVRIVRLVLAELSIPYELVEVDVFNKDPFPANYAERHPFGRIPAFEHNGFRLYETDAIVAYLLECFGEKALMPSDIKERARVRQIMRIMDNYAYPALVWGIYVAETKKDRAGQLQTGELERARKCLGVISDFATSDFLVGVTPTLADFWALPMLAYLDLAPTGRGLLGDFPRLKEWLERMQRATSVAITRFPAEVSPD